MWYLAMLEIILSIWGSGYTSSNVYLLIVWGLINDHSSLMIFGGYYEHSLWRYTWFCKSFFKQFPYFCCYELFVLWWIASSFYCYRFAVKSQVAKSDGYHSLAVAHPHMPRTSLGSPTKRDFNTKMLFEEIVTQSHLTAEIFHHR